MMVDRRSLSIAYGAAVVGHASALVCYPAYTLGRTYVNGEWASASVLTTVTSIASVACSPPGVDDCLITGVRSEDRFSSTEMYNFQCILDDNMCSNGEYAPDSINSDLAWVRDSTACSTVEVEQNVVPTDASSADDADNSISVARSISRKLQTTPTSQPTTSQPTTIQPTTLQPTSPTNVPTTPVPTPTATTALPTTAKPTTATPTSQKPTSLPTNVSPISTPQPTSNPTTAQPNAGRVTFNPTTLPPTPNPSTTNPTTPIPTPMPVPGTTTPLPTPIPTTPAVAPVTNRPTRKPYYYPSPRPPNQCLCPCPGSKSSKNGKHGKSSTTTKAGKTRTKAGKLCPCPCRPVVIPPCYRCRPHVIGRTNRIPQTKFIA